MLNRIILLIVIVLVSVGCNSNKNIEQEVSYNIIKPENGIYAIKKKDVQMQELSGNNYEAVHKSGSKIVKIERYNDEGNLTDEFAVAAITEFEYDSHNHVKYVKYYDKNRNRYENKEFGYWSIEYIYDHNGLVRMEIYRDANSKFLEVPLDNSGNIAKINFIAPVLTYEYLENNLRIKALDENFNLLKEVIGEKPCVPFIDCGESEK